MGHIESKTRKPISTAFLEHGGDGVKRRHSKKSRRSSRSPSGADGCEAETPASVTPCQDPARISHEMATAIAQLIQGGPEGVSEVLASMAKAKDRSDGDGAEDDTAWTEQIAQRLQYQHTDFLRDLSLAMLQQQQQYLSQLASTLEMQQVQFLQQLRARMNSGSFSTQSMESTFADSPPYPSSLSPPPRSGRRASLRHGYEAASCASLIEPPPSRRDRCPPPPNTPRVERRYEDDFDTPRHELGYEDDYDW